MQPDGQTWALVTGASGGIGRAICDRLLAAGWPLLMVARRPVPLAALEGELRARHPNCQLASLALDLAQAESASILADWCQVRDLRLGLLVNGAGVQAFAPLQQQSDAQIQAQLQLNLLAPIRLTRALLPCMDGRSQVVNLGSTFGDIGYPGFSVYCATKAGLHQFSQALGRELGAAGPRICLLAPRATDTELNTGGVAALNRAMGNGVDSPQQVAAALMALLKGGRRRYLGRVERLYVLLNRLFPGLLDRVLGAQRGKILQFCREEASVATPKEKQA